MTETESGADGAIPDLIAALTAAVGYSFAERLAAPTVIPPGQAEVVISRDFGGDYRAFLDYCAHHNLVFL